MRLTLFPCELLVFRDRVFMELMDPLSTRLPPKLISSPQMEGLRPEYTPHFLIDGMLCDLWGLTRSLFSSASTPLGPPRLNFLLNVLLIFAHFDTFLGVLFCTSAVEKLAEVPTGACEGEAPKYMFVEFRTGEFIRLELVGVPLPLKVSDFLDHFFPFGGGFSSVFDFFPCFAGDCPTTMLLVRMLCSDPLRTNPLEVSGRDCMTMSSSALLRGRRSMSGCRGGIGGGMSSSSIIATRSEIMEKGHINFYVGWYS